MLMVNKQEDWKNVETILGNNINVFFSAHCAPVPGKIPVKAFFSLKRQVSSTEEIPVQEIFVQKLKVSSTRGKS